MAITWADGCCDDRATGVGATGVAVTMVAPEREEACCAPCFRLDRSAGGGGGGGGGGGKAFGVAALASAAAGASSNSSATDRNPMATHRFTRSTSIPRITKQSPELT